VAEEPVDPMSFWETLTTIPPEDMLTTNALGFDATGRTLYMFDSRGRNTSALTQMNIKTGKSKVIAKHEKADASGLHMHPTKRVPQAVAFTYARQEWKVLDRSLTKDFAKLQKISGGEPNVVDSTLDGNTWVLAYLEDAGPVRYYLYDRKKKQETFLFTNRAELEKMTLARMHPVAIPSRDQKELVSYLSLPVAADPDGDGKPSTAQPMVLLVHGGPWARDSWGFNALHQQLANRGYAVLSVNYRGSTGFGKDFTNAANMEWSGKMHDDLIDAVDWAVAQGIAQKDKICIAGGSYGGYATLVGLTFTPDVFACGVDIVGPSSIVTLLEAIPEYWKPMQDVFKTRVGDWTTPEGKAKLLEQSPLTRVDKIKKPLLIGQGANDPRVKQAEADQIVAAMKAKKIPVTYVLFPDEGHGFARTPNSQAFFAVMEAFLSAHLGGKYQPATAAEVKGTTIQVPEGAHGVPGLTGLVKELSAK
jgi:dipeptidyl aminopeptidase/acylaminoacyl peptidase